VSAITGQVLRYRLAETTVELPLPNRVTVRLRQVHRQAVDST
jgi:hypothetical protein